MGRSRDRRARELDELDEDFEIPAQRTVTKNVTRPSPYREGQLVRGGTVVSSHPGFVLVLDAGGVLLPVEF